jgi:hypothetical protein
MFMTDDGIYDVPGLEKFLRNLRGRGIEASRLMVSPQEYNSLISFGAVQTQNLNEATVKTTHGNITVYKEESK